MKGILLKIEGNWAHFKKPETNNNPLTHDFITKTALLGMIGAVLGTGRVEMAERFPELSEDLLYGAQVLNHVRKVSWGFTGRRAVDVSYVRPKRMEFIKSPRYKVAIALKGARSASIFDDFTIAAERSEAKHTPVLGLHNCPVTNLQILALGSFEKKSGKFQTESFIATGEIGKQRLDVIGTRHFRVGVDRVATLQSDFHNQKYEPVAYPSAGNIISAEGEYYEFTDGSKWALI